MLSLSGAARFHFDAMPPRFPVPNKIHTLLRPLVAPALLVLLLLWGLRFVLVLPPGYDMPLGDWLAVWWPIGALLVLGSALGLGRRAWAWWRPAGTGGDGVAAPCGEPGWTWTDTVILLACCALGVAVVLRVGRSFNPEGALLGVDAPSYLENILVAARGNWGRYNTDKYILHGRLGAWLGACFGGDYLAAARFMAAACIAGLAPLTYLAGRAAFGRVACAAAASWVLLEPLVWTYAVQTTNYALFAATVGLTVAGAAWVVARPRWWAWLLFGLGAALCASTQEKAPLVLGPLWVGTLAVQAWRRPHRGWRGPAVGLGAMLVVVVLLDPPVRYTPFGSLVVNQREELNVEMPGWDWDHVQRMDPSAPTPISHLLPAALKNGALEATIASLLAPPDADVLRLVKHDESQPGRFVLERDTSIPPLDFRLAFNSVGVRGSFGARLAPQLGLVLLGLLALALPTPRGMERRRLPALLMLVVLPSLMGPISFKYNPRYLIHAFPVMALVAAGGLHWLAASLVGGVGKAWRGIAAGLCAVLGLGWLASVYLEQPAAWTHPTQALTTAPLERVPSDLGADDFMLSMARAARWLEARPEPVIHDCGPVMMWLSLPWDHRFQSITPQACREVLGQQRPPGELIIVSNRDEYRAEGTLRHADLARTGRWELLAAWGPAPVLDGASPFALRDHVAVYRSR